MITINETKLKSLNGSINFYTQFLIANCKKKQQILTMNYEELYVIHRKRERENFDKSLIRCIRNFKIYVFVEKLTIWYRDNWRYFN